MRAERLPLRHSVCQLKKEEINTLTKTLFNIQLGNRREHSRSENGHW